jgi:O-antigen/teichoic acid export membrane protein
MARRRRGETPPGSVPERELEAGLPYDGAAGEDVPLGAAAATTGARVVRYGLWKMFSTALPQVYTLVLSIAASRYLGAAGLGRQSFIAFVEATTVTLLSASMSLALMRYVGEAVGAGRPGAARWLARRILLFELAAAVVGGGAIILLGLFGATPPAAWILAGLAAINGIVATVPGAVLTGLQRWRQATIAGLSTGGVGVAATIVVLGLGGGITGMFAVEAATTALSLLWTGVLARGALLRLGAESTPAPDLGRGALRFAAYSAGGTLVYLIIWRRSEFFFLQHYSTDQEIAYYSIGFAVATGLVRLPSAMAEVLAPAIATLFGAGAHDRIRTGFSRALRLLLLGTFPVVAAAAALGPEAIRLIWGESLSPASKPFLILVAASPIVPLTTLSASLVTGLGRVKFPLVVDTAAAAVDLGVAFALVPQHGAVGAAIASSCALVVSGVPLIVYSSRIAGPISWGPRHLVRGALLAAAGGGVSWAVVASVGGAAGVLLGLVAGTAVFVVLSVLIGFLPRDDAEWLEEALGARAGRLPRRAALALAGRRQ